MSCLGLVNVFPVKCFVNDLSKVNCALRMMNRTMLVMFKCHIILIMLSLLIFSTRDSLHVCCVSFG